ncbi:hypothetical protein PRZ48_003818 [Zasmidium cellare]|uniref:Uncharacterized protein n=1 Tax=Zasmidium cellare TaxID=395010 RepID=A0ABR0EYC5_ZASCE|nr:hypothetical protein PRZ48_003818 [Zasmidium cellare]
MRVDTARAAAAARAARNAIAIGVARAKQVGSWLRSKISSLTYIALHYFVIGFSSILLAVILYAGGNLTFINSVVLGFSACTQSGLNPVDIKSLHIWQQFLIISFATADNPIVLNIPVVVLRLHWVRERLTLWAESSAPSALRSLTTPSTQPAAHERVPENGDNVEIELSTLGAPYDAAGQSGAIPADGGVHSTADNASFHTAIDTHVDGEAIRTSSDEAVPIMSGASSATRGHRHVRFARDDSLVASRDGSTHAPTDPRRTSHIVERVAGLAGDFATAALVPHPPEPHVHTELATSLIFGTRKERKAALTKAIRQNPGYWQKYIGEDRALRRLLLSICVYPLFWLSSGFLSLLCCVYFGPADLKEYLDSLGIHPVWWSMFTSLSMFGNVGLTLTPDSMNHMAGNPAVVIICTILAFAGSSGYPMVLHLGLKVWSRFKAQDQGLRYLLAHPRRCYTLLFSARDTGILLGIILSLIGVDCLVILLLDLSNAALTHYSAGVNNTKTMLPVLVRLIAIFFQAVNTRHTGSSIFNLAEANPGVIVMLIGMMFIAPYPLAMSVRTSGTYDQSHVAQYRQPREIHDEHPKRHYLWTLVQTQVSFDAFWIWLGTFLIVTIESFVHPYDPALSSLNNVLFEVTSAYSNVGLSLGHENVTTSLCGEFSIASKVIISILMYLGRNRGLPYDIDRAVTIPGDELLVPANSEEAGGAAGSATEPTSERTTEAATEVTSEPTIGARSEPTTEATSEPTTELSTESV